MTIEQESVVPVIVRSPDRKRNAAKLVLSGPGSAHDQRVSCLMVTRGHLFPTRHAIACYLAQTHANRELVIVSDTPSSALERHIEAVNDGSIRLIREASATLGTLRNAAKANASGALVCQWDDDDLSHPSRLALMVHALSHFDAAACFLERWTIWWPAREILAYGARRIWEGSMLARRELVPDYPSLSRGEDSAIVPSLMNEGNVAFLDAPWSYLYVVHGANTWHEGHFRGMLKRASQLFEGAKYQQLLGDFREWAPVDEYMASLA